ncbi:hypothetical protein EYF80_039586 [Liparis tanakae]|uniref:Uncharacterized protein n=1 Tax=Liparis tanakae TaxID=230148 RepID=A0A4Z2GBX5_9TELE|nr:hypothetical protein EYF80_039586 [Liparis tanakae]
MTFTAGQTVKSRSELVHEHAPAELKKELTRQHGAPPPSRLGHGICNGQKGVEVRLREKKRPGGPAFRRVALERELRSSGPSHVRHLLEKSPPAAPARREMIESPGISAENREERSSRRTAEAMFSTENDRATHHKQKAMGEAGKLLLLCFIVQSAKPQPGRLAYEQMHMDGQAEATHQMGIEELAVKKDDYCVTLCRLGPVLLAVFAQPLPTSQGKAACCLLAFTQISQGTQILIVIQALACKLRGCLQMYQRICPL